MQLSYNLEDTKVIIVCTYQYHRDSKNLSDIPEVRHNIDRLKTVLEDESIIGIPSENIHVFENPNSVTIRETCYDIIQGVQDTVIFYYCGHGVRQNGKYYLTASNSIRNKIRYNGIPFIDIKDSLKSNPHINKIIILDSCYSGLIIDSLSDIQSELDVFAQEIKGNKGAFIITSSSKNEQSYFKPGGKGSDFTNELCNIIRGGIKSDSQTLSLNQVVEKLKKSNRLDNMSPHSQNTLDYSFKFCHNVAYEPAISSKEQKISYEELLKEYNSLHNRYNDFIESVRYAKQLMNSMLVDETLQETYPKSFLLFDPKDHIGGDFYWFKRVGSTIFIACGDCTGYGVPGAITSSFVLAYLNNLDIDESSLTNNILDELDIRIREDRHKSVEDKKLMDGSEIVLIKVNLKNNILKYSSRGGSTKMVIQPKKYSPIDQYNLIRPKGNINNIGGYSPYKVETFSVEFCLMPGDRVFLFTDGYVDQFGGRHNKKFMFKRFYTMLESLRETKIVSFEKILYQTFCDWMKESEYGVDSENRVDDVLVMGFEV